MLETFLQRNRPYSLRCFGAQLQIMCGYYRGKSLLKCHIHAGMHSLLPKRDMIDSPENITWFVVGSYDKEQIRSIVIETLWIPSA